MPSPVRRSARGLPATTASSTASSLSSRQDRNTRGNHGPKSATPRSLSSDETGEPVARRSQRQPAQKEDDALKEADAIEDNDEEAVNEEEITRCICGHQEYPGPPQSEAFAGIPNAQSDDVGGLFILCDGCSVWQHGGCVGIVEESQSPDKYYCEECRPKQHAVSADSRGQKYSLYLPLHPKAHRKASISKYDDKAKKEREIVTSRSSVDPSTGKRRATMRSKEHDDEEEQLKRAIEESKREVDCTDSSNGRRNGKRSRDDSVDNVKRNWKRSRDDSEDSKPDSKRQRRGSQSAPSTIRIGTVEEDSDDTTTITGRSKKAKAEFLQSARQAEQKEKDKEREKARAEAAGRRQERARSRREMETTEEHLAKSLSNKKSPSVPSPRAPSPPPAAPSEAAATVLPPPVATPTVSASVEKAPVKKGPGKKPGKKLGNNQYTKKTLEQAESSPHGRKRPLNQQASGSGDDISEIVANGTGNGNNPATGKISPGVTGLNENGTAAKGKFGKGKKAAANGNGSKAVAPGEEVERTFTNMQAALSNMSAFVSRQQEEMVTGRINSEKSLTGTNIGGLAASGVPVIPLISVGSEISACERKFEELSCADMALRLQENIAEWQRQWGHLAAA